MTYEEALEYIHGISWTFCKPGLERTRELCERLGNPQKRLKFIHVAGTNGKGSFCSMMSNILIAAGYKVGLYTSPYILQFNERMRVNGENISDAALAEITEYVRPHAEAMTDRPTEFELITAIAFEFFARAEVDVVVLEAGMGGRLDSTNIIDNALLSVITGIALDHTAFLGDSIEKIAAEKAGIIKHGCPVLFGGENNSAEAIIRERAEEMASVMTKTDYSRLSILDMTLDGTTFDYKGYSGLHLPLLGRYQPKNAATVIEACDILRSDGIMNISDEHIREGLGSAVWRARFEILSREPLTIFDGAHNAEGIESATESIKDYFKDEKVYAVSGVLSDKDYKFISKRLSAVAERVYTITPNNPRALSAESFAEVLRGDGVEAVPCPSVEAALKFATVAAREVGRAVVCLGSLYTYADVREAMERITKRRI